MDVVNSTGGVDAFPVLPLLLLARWSHFASVFVLFGASLFWFHVTGGFVRARRATDVLLRWAAGVAAFSGLVWLFAIVANMAGGLSRAADPETLALFLFQTPFGPVVLIRLVLLGGAGLAAVWPTPGRGWLSVLTLVGALLLVNQAWLGHAAAGGAGFGGASMIFAYCVHVLSAAAWLGGLAPLFFVLKEARDFGGAAARRRTREVLLRFSVVATAAVVLIVVSGLVNTGFRVGLAPEHLLVADYGSVLFAKAALVAAMLVLACYNRFVALPRLRAFCLPAEAAMAKLRASVGFELALGLAVLAAAALLGVTPPPQ